MEQSSSVKGHVPGKVVAMKNMGEKWKQELLETVGRDVKMLNNPTMQMLYEKYGQDADLFVGKLLQSREWDIQKTYYYAKASRKSPGHWMRLRAMIGDQCKKVDADAGAVKVGNETWSLLIPNGHGDGDIRYAVMDNSCFNTNMSEFVLSINGKFNIYSYDCGDDVKETLEGNFQVFVYDGIVVFYRY